MSYLISILSFVYSASHNCNITYMKFQVQMVRAPVVNVKWDFATTVNASDEIINLKLKWANGIKKNPEKNFFSDKNFFFRKLIH